MDDKTTYLFHPIENDVIYFKNATQPTGFNDSLPYHRHDAYEIFLFLQGNTKMYIEKVCYLLKPGDLLIISPNELHRSVCLDTQRYERIGINIKKSFIERLSSNRTHLLHCFDYRTHGQNNLIHLNEDQLNEYISLTNKFSRAISSNKYGQDVLVNSYLSEILVFVNLLFQETSSIANNEMPLLVFNTMEYIGEHLTEDITLELLSQKLCYQGSYISYKFKQHTGLTLRSYILDQRIALAKRLLQEGKNVSEACYMSGFKDYANFIRSFSKIAGISPGKYKSQQA